MPCSGGSSNRITPGGQLDAGLDDVEDVAAGVREGLPVDERLLDVGVSRQRPEVVALVVVDRRFVSETRVRRVRIGVDVDVVRVVVHAGTLSCPRSTCVPPRAARAHRKLERRSNLAVGRRRCERRSAPRESLDHRPQDLRTSVDRRREVADAVALAGSRRAARKRRRATPPRRSATRAGRPGRGRCVRRPWFPRPRRCGPPGRSGTAWAGPSPRIRAAARSSSISSNRSPAASRIQPIFVFDRRARRTATGRGTSCRPGCWASAARCRRGARATDSTFFAAATDHDRWSWLAGPASVVPGATSRCSARPRS